MNYAFDFLPRMHEIVWTVIFLIGMMEMIGNSVLCVFFSFGGTKGVGCTKFDKKIEAKMMICHFNKLILSMI